MPELLEKAPAKINLSLVVRGRRYDGYHELNSLVAFADCGDVVSVREADDLRLDLAGPFAKELSADDTNLVLQAIRRFDDYLGVKTTGHFTLEKNLPVASGIGGGSADAAATLRLLRRLHGREVEQHALASLGLCIGADVPVCLDARPAMMWGKGELIERMEALPGFWFVLINPGVAVSTAAVFAALNAPSLVEKQAGPTVPQFADVTALAQWLDAHGNDMERAAMKIAPAIFDAATALAATRDCRVARMSGSGATCFGIYDDEKSARAAEAALRIVHPNWWVVAARRL
mgnify:CR=1 FL=1|tara:strand:- start:1011 stop:1877 length:867 start_codon:yes stop_codon:yes gene_type:complete